MNDHLVVNTPCGGAESMATAAEAQPTLQQELCNQATHGVAYQDRFFIESLNDA